MTAPSFASCPVTMADTSRLTFSVRSSWDQVHRSSVISSTSRENDVRRQILEEMRNGIDEVEEEAEERGRVAEESRREERERAQQRLDKEKEREVNKNF